MEEHLLLPPRALYITPVLGPGAETQLLCPTIGSNWDFWEDVEQPIDSVRERLGVPPLNSSLAAA